MIFYLTIHFYKMDPLAWVAINWDTDVPKGKELNIYEQEEQKEDAHYVYEYNLICSIGPYNPIRTISPVYYPFINLYTTEEVVKELRKFNKS